MKGASFSRQRNSKNENPEEEMNLVCSKNSQKAQVLGKRSIGDEPRQFGRTRSHRPCQSQ